MRHRNLVAFALALSLCSTAFARSDWSNLGGNSARNGLSTSIGPTAATPAWTNVADPAVIAWQPVTLGARAFTIRESGFPQSGGAANDELVCYDLGDGSIEWSLTVPYNGDPGQQWIAWIAGAHGNHVYACRAENGKPNPIYAYDAATGQQAWISQATTSAFAYDGAVFAPDGDLLVGDHTKVVRIDAATGNTVWTFNRTRAVSGNCGVAATSSAVFLDNGFFASAQWVTKIDLATGTLLYHGPQLPGGSEQNHPFLSPDGQTVYFARTQNNPSTDRLFAFDDTGSALVPKWDVPVRWTTSHEHGVGPDGSIYTFAPSHEFVRLDPATGAIMDSAGVLPFTSSGNLSPKTVVDSAGNVYVSNGWASSPAGNGRVWGFSADLSQSYFTLSFQRQNQGGPALANDGTLIVCDLDGVHAYRDPVATVYCTAKVNSQLCVPQIAFAGSPSMTSASPFTISASSVINNKNGLLFYGVNGPNAVAFQGGHLCVKTPIQRTATQGSGGNPPPNDCSGAFAFDFNAYAQTGADPNLIAGVQVNGQYWSRDPQDPFTTNLTDAIEFLVQP